MVNVVSYPQDVFNEHGWNIREMVVECCLRRRKKAHKSIKNYRNRFFFCNRKGNIENILSTSID